jgi:anti-sigma regulatory factor (Ser/Thr protein kinase)
VADETLPQPSGSLQIEVPATADRLVYVRQRLTAWLRPLGLSGSMAHDIVLAVDEACTNAIEHAYTGTAGSIDISVALADNEITVRVADSGAWQEPQEKRSRGRGLRIIQALSDRLELDRSASGTTVRMSFPVGQSGLR